MADPIDTPACGRVASLASFATKSIFLVANASSKLDSVELSGTIRPMKMQKFCRSGIGTRLITKPLILTTSNLTGSTLSPKASRTCPSSKSLIVQLTRRGGKRLTKGIAVETGWLSVITGMAGQSFCEHSPTPAVQSQDCLMKLLQCDVVQIIAFAGKVGDNAHAGYSKLG